MSKLSRVTLQVLLPEIQRSIDRERLSPERRWRPCNTTKSLLVESSPLSPVPQSESADTHKPLRGGLSRGVDESSHPSAKTV
jgi:hypothetical protein